MKTPLLIILIFILAAIFLLLTGCATEYYPPRDSEKQGAVKREGFVPWSNGVGKNLPLANPSFSIIGN